MAKPDQSTIPVLKNYINGKEVASESQDFLEIVNPTNGESVAKSPVSTPEEVGAAMKAAKEAFVSWKKTTPMERQAYLNKIADELEKNTEKLVESQYPNTGQPRQDIRDVEIIPGIDNLRFFSAAARILEGKSASEYIEGYTSYIRREPVGIVGQIAPWNFPFLMLMWKIGPALAAGNTIVLKPSDTTPEGALLVAKIAGKILPKGVFNVVLGNGGVGAAIVDHEIPSMVSITGSVRAGQAVAENASKTVKRTHLELGGKAPALVFEGVDLEKTAERITEFSLFNAGQECTAITRVLIQDTIYDEFIKKLTKHFEKAKTGNQDDSKNFFGPMNNINHFNGVMEIINNLPKHVKILTGGKQTGDPKGFFIEATLLEGARQNDDIVQKETFGPVVTVQKFKTETEALEKANDVDFALAASIWTNDHARAMRLSKDIEAGVVWVNSHDVYASEMPHGGFKYSGYGKDMSSYSFEEYTRVKHIAHSLEES